MEIHGKFSGQAQGGISSPRDFPFVFVFTGQTGEKYGYRDEFRPDGVFLLTGEGTKGDMTFLRGNRAINDHQRDGKEIHLFQILRKKGYVQYMGEARVIGHHFENRPDIEGKIRKAIIFELEMLVGELFSKDNVTEPGSGYSASGNEPEGKILDATGSESKSSISYEESIRRIYERSEEVKRVVLLRAKGDCELCSKPAPFTTPKKKKYLEPHHLTRVSDGGPDQPLHVAAICPNCHREVHYGEFGEEKNAQLRQTILEKEKTRIRK